MEEKDLKPGAKQRLLFALIAALFIAIPIGTYTLIVMGKGDVNYSKMTIEQLQNAYSEKMAALDAEAAELSSKYFEEFKSYRSNVKGYNKNTANSNGVTSNDLKEGTGETVGDSNYSAYYIGWCSDESIFDSSFDNYDEPTALTTPIVVQPDTLIEGWYMGVEGMKIGGVREITIPGSLAYGDYMEVCGGKNSPLKFIVMAIERSEKIQKLNEELNEIYSTLSSVYTQSQASYDTTTTEDTTTTSGE